jgi:hypothetical protein
VRPSAVPSVSEANARRERSHRKPDRGECRGEKRVLLEAVAAALRRHELRLERREVQPDRATEEYVEILEGDRLGVRAVEGEEGIQAGRRNFGQADTPQVGGQVVHDGSQPILSRPPSRAPLP